LLGLFGALFEFDVSLRYEGSNARLEVAENEWAAIFECLLNDTLNEWAAAPRGGRRRWTHSGYEICNLLLRGRPSSPINEREWIWRGRPRDREREKREREIGKGGAVSRVVCHNTGFDPAEETDRERERESVCV